MGWRYWYLDPQSWQLRSVSQKPVPWPPEKPLRAVCVLGRHRAPEPGCNCGIYAAPDLPTLRQHGLCLSEGVLVVGEVALWGRVVTEEGFRGEFAYPLRLAVVTETVNHGSVAGVGEGMRAYGVEVTATALADAVGDVSGALLAFQRMSGPAHGGR